MSKSTRYSPEVRERAVRMVFEHQGEYESQWAALSSIASKIGCTAETLRKWVRRAERDQGLRTGLTSDESDRLKALERENRELRLETARLGWEEPHVMRMKSLAARKCDTQADRARERRRPSAEAAATG